MNNTFAGTMSKQYEWIYQTRNQLFNYCESLSATDYIKELEQFGGASIRNLHSHVAACYHNWLGCFALKRQQTAFSADKVPSVQEMRQVYKEIDLLVEVFLNAYDGQTDLLITGTPPWQAENMDATPLWLFTHTVTHEFHHKGQIVSMSRQLGYIPTDTDLYHHTRPYC